MGNFVNFIREAEERRNVNPKSEAQSFVNMYNKLSKNIFTFVEKEVVKNEFGDLIGFLYIYRMQGLRINFKDGLIHSFSKWKTYNPNKAPDLTTVLKNYKKITRVGIVSMYPEITNALSYTSDMLADRTGYRYHGTVYTNINSLIKAAYFKNNLPISTILDDLQELDVTYNDVKSAIVSYARYKGISIDVDAIYAEEQKKKSKVSKVNEPDIMDIEDPDDVVGEIESDGDNTEIYANVDEEVAEPPQNKFNDDELISQITADPLPVFRKLNSYVLMTAQRINNALLITGQGGVGKSYNVERILSTFGTEGKDYVIMKGTTSTAAMYKFIYDHYNKIVVFDDCDDVLTDDAAINILKAALDSGKTRRISYNKAKSNVVNTFDCKDHKECEQRLAQWSAENKGKPAIPSTFEFKGGIIFISNMSAERMVQGKAAALLTRCMRVDIKLLASEVILRMESCLPHIKIYNMDGVDITNEDIKKEVFKWISSEEYLNDPRIRGKEISFRLFSKCYMYRYAKLPMWQELCFCV